MEKKTLYCDICGKEIERTDNVQMSVEIERKSSIWDELGGWHVSKCNLNDLCPTCIYKLFKGFEELGIKFERTTEDNDRHKMEQL